MKNPVIEVELVLPTGDRLPANIVCESDHANRKCMLTLSYEQSVLQAVAGDYFRAFAMIRENLLDKNIMPWCYGASRNVWPSGMMRDMAQGLQAYRMTIGKHVGPTDVVRIFGSAPDIDPVSPEEQERFFKSWVKSLRT